MRKLSFRVKINVDEFALPRNSTTYYSFYKFCRNRATFALASVLIEGLLRPQRRPKDHRRFLISKRAAYQSAQVNFLRRRAGAATVDRGLPNFDSDRITQA
jgi:hypothetical protein